jgi:hypothetical protein
MVIRAIVEHGQIRPLEPLPAEWADGRELRVLEAEPREAPEEPSARRAEMDALSADAFEPEARARIEAALSEADRHARSKLHRAMGLS